MKLPCIVSEWTAWTQADPSGKRFRSRMVLRPALNGGQECPELLEQDLGIDIEYSNLKCIFSNVNKFG